MKKMGVVITALCGTTCLVGYMYRGPIMDLARAFKTEIEYYFSINADNADKVKLGSDDALANRVLQNIEINDAVESPEWSMETAAGEVFEEFTDRLPFIEKAGNWIQENVLKKSADEGEKALDGEEGSSSMEDRKEEGKGAE